MTHTSLVSRAAWPGAAALLAIAWYAAPGEPPGITDPAVTVVSVRVPVAMPPPEPTRAEIQPVAPLSFAAPAMIAPTEDKIERQEALPTDLAALEKAGSEEPPPVADGAALAGP